MVWSGFDFGGAQHVDPDNKYADPIAALEQREYIVREKVLGVAKARSLRERVKECYSREGVNHYQNCQEVVQQYLESIKGVGVYRYNTGIHDKGHFDK